MKVPFTKAHGAKNDFLLTWASQAPAEELATVAIAICDRHTGIGADGWLLVQPAQPARPASIRLFNADGSEAEISGNGTRCAAAFLVDAGGTGPCLTIQTGAGPKYLRLIRRDGNTYLFEMNMGQPITQEARLSLRDGDLPVVLADVGNPQCVLFVDDFALDWRSLGEEIERHRHFPNRTNVSFVRVLDPHRIDVRFFERGAGETMSSGTGSTGAAAAAIAQGFVESPVTVETPAGPLQLDLRNREVYLVGPAEITARGEFYVV